MAITVVGSFTNDGSGTAISVTHGLTIQSGDWVMIWVSGNGNRTFVDNNGGSSFSEQLDNNTSTGGKALYYRTAGGSEPSSYAFTMSGIDRWNLTGLVLRGVDTASPFDVAPDAGAGTSASGTGATLTVPSITIATAGAMGFMYGTVDNATATFSSPTNGYTDEIERGAGQVAALYRQIWASTGATGTAAITQSSASAWWTSHYAVKPAAGGGVTEQPIAKRFGGVPFMGAKGSAGFGGGTRWERNGSGLFVPRRTAA
jgi:hypothetical protein